VTFNYLTNPNQIFPGQKLVIPASLRLKDSKWEE